MFSSFGYGEMILFGIVALMLFGSKLPDVARNFGRGYREMRKKVDDLQREFRDWDKPDTSAPAKPFFTPQDDEPSKRQPSAPKFVPPSDDDEAQ
jgi:sec-independent protein translocase protein TatA